MSASRGILLMYTCTLHRNSSLIQKNVQYDKGKMWCWRGKKRSCHIIEDLVCPRNVLKNFIFVVSFKLRQNTIRLITLFGFWFLVFHLQMKTVRIRWVGWHLQGLRDSARTRITIYLILKTFTLFPLYKTVSNGKSLETVEVNITRATKRVETRILILSSVVFPITVEWPMLCLLQNVSLPY